LSLVFAHEGRGRSRWYKQFVRITESTN